MNRISVTNEYLKFRNNVLKYTNEDMNLKLENNDQVYIAVFDIPSKSSIIYGHTKTLALLFGLNTHIYFGNGDAITELEKDNEVIYAMQSLFISSSQVLKKMQLLKEYDYYNSQNVRAYLKTGKGLYFKELSNDCEEDRFLIMLMKNVFAAIAKCI